MTTTDSPAAVKQGLLERFSDFPSPTLELIEASDDRSVSVAEIRYLKPLDRWAQGRCVLIGDAAHAMTPDIGRGASEALVDGVVLTDCLVEAGPEGVESALRAFEARRQDLLAGFQREAPRLGGLFAWSNPVVCRVRDQIMKQFSSRRLLREWEAEFAAASSVSGGAF